MEILKKINIDNVEIKFDSNLGKYTTIKLGNLGSIAFCKTIEGLKELISFLGKNQINYRMIGWGANQVLLNTEETLFIKLDFEFNKEIFDNDQNEFELPASIPLNTLTSMACKYGFSGWEVFTGIPASLGGAIAMNAGTSLGEIGSLIKSVKILKSNGLEKNYICSKDSFCYRNNNFLEEGDIIVSAVIKHNGQDPRIKDIINEYHTYRKNTQPLTTKNCGSVFKNKENFVAGKVIDTLGLKGFGLEHLRVSLKHGNFIENLSDANAQEFKELIDQLLEEIERYSGQRFELEVKIY